MNTKNCIREILAATFESKELRWIFFFSFLALSVGILLNLCIPILLKKIVESFSSSSTIPWILLSYGFIWMIGQASHHLRLLMTYKMEQRIALFLNLKLLSHLYTLSHSFFLNQKPGAITNILRRAQRNIPSIVLGLFFHVIPIILEFLFVIVLISILYPFVYSFLMIAILGLFFIYTSLSMKVVFKDREKANEIDKNVDGIVSDWLSNYEAIKVFGQSHLALQTCEKELKKREAAEVAFITKYNISHLIQACILGVGLSALTYLTGQGVLNHSLTVGDFILFNGYVLQFIIPIGILGQITNDIKKALLDMKSILEILITSSETKEISNPIHFSGNPAIEFEDVSFKYTDKTILENISFKINPGETVLIVGRTGSGKSTLAKLLLRLYDPTEGRILINGVDLRHLSLKSLYNTIGWVPQESYLLNDTIQANIQFVCPEATQHAIEEALSKAHLLEFIKKLPLGLDTIVGDRGLKLSGGEKQRLSLARLFLKKPKICIFDESTSSLDNKTSLIIQNHIEEYLEGSTKIIITHKPYTGKVDQTITLTNSKNSLKQLLQSVNPESPHLLSQLQ